MKRYTIKIIINEGSDEFWETVKSTGCDEVLDAIKGCLDDQGWLYNSEHENNGVITLEKFEDE